MQNKLIIFLSICTLSILFLGCAQKVHVKSLEPAIINDASIKNTSISEFSNDSVHLRESILSKMGAIFFQGKQYFNIVNREDTNKILKEQKLQDSGLVSNKGDEEYVLSDIDSIILGKVIIKNKKHNRYRESRTNYDRCLKYSKNGKTCVKDDKYIVSCIRLDYNLQANIKITKTTNANNIFTKNFVSSIKQSRCSDDSTPLQSDAVVFQTLASNIANQFVSLISPSYKTTSVEMLEDEDIEYTSEQSKLLENALKLVELNEIQGANEILIDLVEYTNFKSETALYNLAVTYELMGMLDSADVYYQRAKKITLRNNMTEPIILAAKRIKKAIKKQNLAQKQITN